MHIKLFDLSSVETVVSEFLGGWVQRDSELWGPHDVVADSNVYVGICQLRGDDVDRFRSHICELSNLELLFYMNFG